MVQKELNEGHSSTNLFTILQSGRWSKIHKNCTSLPVSGRLWKAVHSILSDIHWCIPTIHDSQSADPYLWSLHFCSSSGAWESPSTWFVDHSAAPNNKMMGQRYSTHLLPLAQSRLYGVSSEILGWLEGSLPIYGVFYKIHHIGLSTYSSPADRKHPHVIQVWKILS